MSKHGQIGKSCACLKRRTWQTTWSALAVTSMSLQGCAFFDNGYDACFDDPQGCSATEPGAGGTRGGGLGGAGSGGDNFATGGDGALSGGSSGDGGSFFSGGSGGSSTGGSSSGGSGSGGAASGGSGSGGGAGSVTLNLRLNEMRNSPLGWVEVYNSGSTALDLTGVGIAVGPNDLGYALATLCDLSGITLPAGAYLVAQEETGDCLGTVEYCVSGCSFGLGNDEYVWLVHDTARVQTVKYPSGDPGIYNSWQAGTNAPMTFCQGTASPGDVNNASCF